MEKTGLSRSPLQRVRLACGGAAAGLGTMVLLGWATGRLGLMSLGISYIPMAPNTAMSFVVLGGGLCLLADQAGGRWRRRITGLGALLVVVVAALRLFEYAARLAPRMDSLIFRVPGAKFGLVPVGVMAFPTAISFVLAGGALALVAWPAPWRRRGDVAGTLALAVLASGLVFSLGYLYGAPLLYGTQSIPMALNTSLGFVLVGVGLVVAAGPRTFPLRRLSGPSVRARLLRVFLPLVAGTVCILAWLSLVVTTRVGASSAALASAALVAAAILVVGPILDRIARRVGDQIERAEQALQQAHDELEIKVQERTGELSRAHAELTRAYHDLKRTHEAIHRAHLELKQAQSRMLQQAKMASLGQTAAGVAHEINNPLAFVTSNIAVLKREVAGLLEILRLYQQAEATLGQSKGELLGRIHAMSEAVDLPYVLDNLVNLMDRSRDGLKRIQKIVADLRDFAHLDEADQQEADLNAGVVATLALMRGLADKQQVALEEDLGPLPRLSCCPAKLNLMLQNLVSNAIDACRPGGKVVVRTRPSADGGVAIEVCDDGCGIEPEIRDQVFDPFFTTKAIGKGTGLGLSMSYGIVKDHGGTIEFESTPGLGTRFTVRLPPAPPRDLASAPAGQDGSIREP